MAAACLAAASAGGVARAERAGTDAQPGIIDVAAAALGEPELRVALLGGYGYLGSVLGADDRHHRTAAGLAASWRPLRWLTAGLELDGRMDRHTNLGGPSDSSYVGVPRLSARAAHAIDGDLVLGAQLGLAFPGTEAPSVVASAISPELLGLATYAAGTVQLSAQAGFRLDRSAETAEQADDYSAADRLSLGVSDANAIVAGAGVAFDLGRVDLMAAWNWDLLVGENAPPVLESPMRASLGVSYAFNERVGAMGYAQARLSATPDQDMDAPLAPALPSLAAMAVLQLRFDLHEAAAVPPPVLVEEEPPPAAPEPARLAGRVTTFGYPLSGVEVTVLAAGEETSLTTDPDGRFALGDLEPGQAQVRLRRDGYEPVSRTVELEAGSEAGFDIELEQSLPPGQLRGVVRSFDGTPLVGEIAVEPAGIRMTTGEDGEFRLDIPPGSYEVSFSAAGHEDQRRSVVIEENGVTILNVDLPR